MSEYDLRMAELHRRFLVRARAERVELDAASARGDRAAIVAQAHKLGGIAGIFGFAQLGDAAFALEEAGRAGGPFADELADLRHLLQELGTPD